MKDRCTQDVLDRAAYLSEMETAAQMLFLPRTRWDLRAACAAALAALLTLMPTVSAAMML